MIQLMLAIWSLVPLLFLNSAWSSQFHILLKPGLENFEHYFASVWDQCSCAVVWTFFGIAFLWDWNENWPFPVLWPLLSFPNCRERVEVYEQHANVLLLILKDNETPLLLIISFQTLFSKSTLYLLDISFPSFHFLQMTVFPSVSLGK